MAQHSSQRSNQRSNQRSSRKSKSFLNNPIVLILIVLMLLVAAASSMGFLDQFIARLSGQSPVQAASPSNQMAGVSTARPANGPQPTAAANSGDPATEQPALPQGQDSKEQAKTQPVGSQPSGAQKPSDTRQPNKTASPGTVPAQSKPAPSSGKVSAKAQEKQVAVVQPGQSVQPPKQPSNTAANKPADTSPKKQDSPQKKPRLEVPSFSFKVGRSNPFSPFKGQPGPVSSPRPSPQPQPQPIQRPSTVNPPTNSAPKEPAKPAKPEGPRSWRYTGYSANGQHRFAVIETPTNAYIVSTGDRIEGIWLVTEVTGDHVTIKNAEQTIVLPLGGDGK